MGLKRKMEQGECVVGVFCKTNDPFFIEVIGKAGMDFVILDCEHGPNSPREVLPLLLAARAGGVEAVVRVGSQNALEIQRIQDLGPAGIQVPQVNDAEEARALVRSSKFHPQGMRGVCRNVRPADYSLLAKESYFREANEGLVVAHLEGKDALARLDSILEVEGIDVFFIGPNDLSQSMGLPGRTDHPKVQAEIARIVEACRRKGCFAGIYADSAEEGNRYRKLGASYVAISVDVALFARQLVTLRRSWDEGVPSRSEAGTRALAEARS